MDDKEEEEFKEFLKETNARNICKQQVICKIELVKALVARGNSLRQIYNFLNSKGEITFSYAQFTRVYKSLTIGNNKSEKANQKQPEKPSAKAETKTVSTVKVFDVSPKTISSIDDVISPEEKKRMQEIQKRMLAMAEQKPWQTDTLPELRERRKQ